MSLHWDAPLSQEEEAVLDEAAPELLTEVRSLALSVQSLQSELEKVEEEERKSYLHLLHMRQQAKSSEVGVTLKDLWGSARIFHNPSQRVGVLEVDWRQVWGCELEDIRNRDGGRTLERLTRLLSLCCQVHTQEEALSEIGKKRNQAALDAFLALEKHWMDQMCALGEHELEEMESEN
mmetsp:Transcript_31106/g.43108  ORF Transcript_31106/g.43108 Transcript_31106/m.43108 type:complete len:178 (+) Transcript_31106:152-685(+)|eukprot:CAMPEP_0196572534 /NCGR_PEP_ID=MMETSP1081-20130531/2574_1 /TAXON_ID=36882 /ORGANISM="Pyramimonas amylifera, Strain CCMP720" /LENGTH=177 /DNA_ID=CAMNT_0041889891 /DNA_START=145 /DNA_END=678 /DNA_ORIENTATION=-